MWARSRSVMVLRVRHCAREVNLMVTLASQVRPLAERRFFTWMAVTMAAAAFAGFAPTYYLSAFNAAPRPLLTPSVHIHAALATTWILVLIAQVRLIAYQRRDVHRLLGIAGSLGGAATFVLGIYVAIHSERRVHNAATAGTLLDPYVFLIFPFTTMGMFAGCAALGVMQRRHAEAHKRFMLLATASLIIPALARLVTQIQSAMGVIGVPGVVGAVLAVNVFLAAMVVHDFHMRGRLHPVTLWGGGILLLSEPLRFLIGFSAPWQAFAR